MLTHHLTMLEVILDKVGGGGKIALDEETDDPEIMKSKLLLLTLNLIGSHRLNDTG